VVASILVVLVVKAFEIKRPVIVCGTVILFFTSLLGGLEMWATLSERTPEMKLQEQTVQSPKPVTLRQLFENGWPNLIGIYDVTMVSTSSRRRPDVEISWRLNGDFTSRSRFLEFFLRDAVAPKDAVDICKVIAENYQFFINEADLNVDIIGQWPGDTEVTHMRDMVFSRRIYIYYGNPDFSMEQKGILESICKKYNLAVEFRGSDYEQLHFLDHLELRPKPLTPHSVLLPKASVPGPRITVHNLSSQKPVEGIIDNPLRKRQIKYLTNHDV